jgi:MFS family permease
MVTRDGTLLMLAKGLRTFGFGLLSVVLGLYLEELGFRPSSVGLIFTAALLGSAFLTAIFSSQADRFGRRRTLLMGTTLMVASGVVFALTDHVGFMLLAALTGTISPTSGEVGPFETIESAILPQTASRHYRNRVFGWYNSIGAVMVALGSLAAAIPAWASVNCEIDLLVGYRAAFAVFALSGALVLIAQAQLSQQVEIQPNDQVEGIVPLHRSRRAVARLSALFALDSLGGGFVIQSLVVFWFALKFNVGAEVLGPVFFGVNLIKAGSYFIAVRLADRIGLLNTMVFTHLPSNVMLMLIPLMPTLPSAIALLLARHVLSQMDVPTRAAYIVGIVDPEERTAATGVTSLVRTLTGAISPAIGGMALQVANLGLPFFLGGGLKILYDLALFSSFRNVKPEED